MILFCIIISMSERLNLIAERLAAKKNKVGDLSKIVSSAFDFLSLSDYLTPEENKQRLAIRDFVEQQITHKIVPYIEKSEFAAYVIPLLKEKGFVKHFFGKPYGYGSRVTMQGIVLMEVAKGDAGIATLMVVTRLLAFTISEFGSQEQKDKYLPQLANLDITGAWALTERNVGSDASHIETRSEKTEKGYKINGNKNWIGNGTGDLVCLWAKDKKSDQMEAFLLETKGLKGFQTQLKKHKMVLRSINHCEITLKDVQVSEAQRLPKVSNFQEGTSKALKSSRVAVLWVATGICVGSYQAAIKYTTTRQQFGRSVSSFQMIQEKLVKMMAAIQGMILLCFRISKLVEENKDDIGTISMAKAWITERGREVVRMGREVCGGNGLLHQNYVIRAMADLEATYTYQGTYDINVLIAGRQLTGFSAFK